MLQNGVPKRKYISLNCILWGFILGWVWKVEEKQKWERMPREKENVYCDNKNVNEFCDEVRRWIPNETTKLNCVWEWEEKGERWEERMWELGSENCKNLHHNRG